MFDEDADRRRAATLTAPRLETALAGADPALAELLAASAALHEHLCPRQVLGVRMSLLAGTLLDLPVPQPRGSHSLLAIAETDGCFVNGLAVAANCGVGHRTLRVEDYGKVAATFVRRADGQAVRIAPHPEARRRAGAYAPEARHRWEAYLLGYQRLPADELFVTQAVELSPPLARLISHFRARARCAACGEEIINEREVIQAGVTLCRPCAQGGYCRPADPRTRA